MEMLPLASGSIGISLLSPFLITVIAIALTVMQTISGLAGTNPEASAMSARSNSEGQSPHNRESAGKARNERPKGAPSVGGRLVPSARDLRVFRHETLPRITLVLIFGTLALATLFHLLCGRLRLRQGRSGRTIVRFSLLERSVHWLTSASFLILALTGLNKTFGRQVLLPLIGPESFAVLSRAARDIHNDFSYAFLLGLLLMIALWVRDNTLSRLDMGWLAAGGSLLADRHLQADRFNGGQKIVFWSVVIGGSVLSATGYSLIFPDALSSDPGQRLASMAHGLLAALLISLMIAHAYVGSLGVEGAMQGMISGRVDLNWALQHHAVWAQRLAGEDNEPDIKGPIATREH